MAEELIGWHEGNENKWRLAYHLCWSANVYLRMARGKDRRSIVSCQEFRVHHAKYPGGRGEKPKNTSTNLLRSQNKSVRSLFWARLTWDWDCLTRPEERLTLPGNISRTRSKRSKNAGRRGT